MSLKIKRVELYHESSYSVQNILVEWPSLRKFKCIYMHKVAIIIVLYHVQPRLSGPDPRFSGVASVLLWVGSQIAMHMDSADLPWAFLNTAGHDHTVYIGIVYRLGIIL